MADEIKTMAKVTFAEGAETGNFCDNIAVGFNPEIFIVTLMQSTPEGTVRVHGRYILTPTHAARLLEHLSAQVQNYAKQNGPITQPAPQVAPTDGAASTN